MTENEHAGKLVDFLSNISKKGASVQIKVEDWNVIYSMGNNSCGIPLPDGEPTPTQEELELLQEKSEEWEKREYAKE